MTRKRLIIALMWAWVIGGSIFILSGCGVNSAGNDGAYLNGPNGAQVWCLGSTAGGLSCDWDGMHRKFPNS